MSIMAQIDKNTVSAADQTKKYVFFPYSNEEGVKILFCGNSITYHEIREDTGWYNEWGMAASSRENDYVHQIIKMLENDGVKADICICQAALWESRYKIGTEFIKSSEYYKGAHDFEADIIVMRVIENSSTKEFDAKAFKKSYIDMTDYLNKSGRAKVIVTSSFWKHPGDGVLREIARENNYPYIYLGDLGEKDGMKALGKFKDEGIQNHPGDKGMSVIAQRIYSELGNMLVRNGE